MTNTPTSPTTPADAVNAVDPRAVTDLMHAFEQVVKIGVFYPPGHNLCDQAASGFLQALGRVVGKTSRLVFELVAERLVVQGVELDDDLSGAIRFRELIDALGITGVEFDRSIEAAEVYAFVTSLLAARKRLQGSHSFEQLRIEDIPASVRLHYREFRVRALSDDADGDGGGDPSRPSVESLLATLKARGLDAQQLARCRRLLTTLPEELETSLQSRADLPSVSWRDVEQLLIRVAETDPEAVAQAAAQPTTNSSLDALAVVFKRLGGRPDASHRETIDLLLELSQRDPVTTDGSGNETTADPGPGAASKAKQAFAPPPADTTEDIAVLRTAIAEFTAGATDRPELQTPDRCEDLSILMLLLKRDQKLAVQMRIERQLNEILATPLEPQEWNIVVEGIRRLLTVFEGDRVGGAIAMVTSALRHTDRGMPLAFLCDVCRDISLRQRPLLWPFLVEQILRTGRRVDAKVFHEACELAGSLSEEAMRECLPQLELLEVLRGKEVAVDLFQPPPSALYPVFAELLESSQAAWLAKRLVAGLRRSPPSWIGEAVLPLIERLGTVHRIFLGELLRQQAGKGSAEKLTKAAGKIIGESLPVLSRRRRTESWVPASIRSVARLPVPDAQALLRSIQNERRWLVIPVWPGRCRAAAREALKSLKIRTE
jgi:hypothetical protein